ncbi:MAG TPA: PH domain-containing protein [Leptolyngbya sp.]|jgi:hypothetical protein|nr:PH domain-containing protein [Leptolyngbya sp.]
MQLSISDSQLKIDLNGWERVWAFYFNADLSIPLNHIIQVSTSEPLSSWTDMRMPGTSLPGVIKAGTYYTDRGKEFWYATRSGRYLVLELENEFYKRIILTVDQNQFWADRIQESG